MKSELWVEEKLEDFAGFRFKVERTLFSGVSEFQSVDIVETKGHGKMLLNDGLVMLTERDEFVYHDMISHVPLFTHPNPRKVLIIGGGDGGTAREVLRHPSVEKCVMVEIDKMVVDACVEHIPQTAACLSNPKLELRIEDGIKYAKETKEKFDVILVDSTDPIGPAQPLFGPEFYRDLYACLNDDGIVVSQGESAWFAVDMQQTLLGVLAQVFPIVRLYKYHNLGYPGGLWGFTYASKKLDPIANFDPSLVKKSGLEFNYYNEETHRAAFSLPQFMKRNLAHLFK